MDDNKKDQFQAYNRNSTPGQQGRQGNRPASPAPPSPSAGRFSPAGFEPSRPAPGAPPRVPPPPSRPASPREQAARGGFNPAGFDARAGQRAAAPPPVRPQAPDQRRPAPSSALPPRPQTPPASRGFQLRIEDSGYSPSPPPGAGRGPSGGPPAAPPSAQGAAGPGYPPKKKKKKPRGRVSRFFEALLLAAGAVVCAVFLSVFALNSLGDMLGMNKEENEASVTLTETDTLSDIAKALKQKGIITQPLTFQIYAKITGKDAECLPGDYLLDSKMAYNQILNRLANGAREKVMEISVTFPEGLTIVQIAEKLEQNNVCSAEKFLEAADTGSFGYAFEDQIPDNPLRFHRLEGYIFPDTYRFYVPEDPKSVVNRFLDSFNSHVTEDLYGTMQEMGLTLDETITLSSIIQKETGNLETMYEVSSVFHNRLASAERFPLQSDATTDYIEKTIRPNLPVPNQAIFDAYDTWVCEKLPAGPINNPGMDAIRAALDPTESDFFFFLSDQKGEYHFSKTLAEHQAFLQSAGDAHGTTIEHDESPAPS